MYNTGPHVDELVRVGIGFLRNDNSKLYLPTEVQEDYPSEHSPPPVVLGCSDDTT